MRAFKNAIFILLTTAVLGWWVWLQFLVEHTTGWNYWFNVAYGMAFIFAGLAFFFRLWKWRKDYTPDFPAITLIAVGLLSHGVGQFVWTYYNIALNVEAPPISIADIFYSAAELLEAAGFLVFLFHRAKDHRARRYQGILIVLATIAASFYVSYAIQSWVYVDGSPIFSIDAFYTIVSFLIVFLIVLNLFRERHEEFRMFLVAMIVGATLNGLANVVFAVRYTSNTYWNGDIADLLFAVSGLAFLFAGIWCLPAQSKHGSPSTSGFWRLEIILPIGILLGGILACAQLSQSVYTSGYERLTAETEQFSVEAETLISQAVQQEDIRVSALAGFFLSSNEVTAVEFDSFVAELTAGSGTAASFGFLGPDNQPLYYVSHRPDAFGTSIEQASSAEKIPSSLLDLAKETGSLVISQPRYLDGEYPGILLLRALEDREGAFTGTVFGAIDLENLLAPLQVTLQDQDYTLVLASANRTIATDGQTIYDGLGREVLQAEENRIGGAEAHIALPEPGAIRFVRRIGYEPVDWMLTVSPSVLQMHDLYVNALLVFLATLFLVALFACVVYLTTSQQTRLRDEVLDKTGILTKRIEELRLYRFYLDHVSDAVVAIADGRVEYANHAAQQLFVQGKRKNDLFGMPSESILGLISEESRDELEASMKGGDTWEGEAALLRPHGSRDLLMSATPLVGEGGVRVGTIMLARDISDRKAVERAKTQFVSLVAHQLRAPMTHMRWMIGVLIAQKRLPKATRQQLQDLEKLVAAENHLVGDLLNVSRIERGLLKLTMEDVSLKTVVDAAVAPVQDLAHERHVNLVLGAVPAKAKVYIDKEKITEAIRNIVDNAIKYSPEGTRVSLEVNVDDPQFVSVVIHDQGPGIPEENWDTLFEIKTTGVSSSSGAGLGLYLAKKFVDAVGGSIRFESSSRGTTFFMRLPRPAGRG